MGWNQSGDRTTTSSILAGVIAGIIILLMFPPIPDPIRTVAIALMVVLGVGNLVFLLNVQTRISNYLSNRLRENAVNRHPDYKTELYRMYEVFRAILFENSGDHPSLVNQGVEAAQRLSQPDGNFGGEIRAGLFAVETSFNLSYEYIVNNRRAESIRKTSEFFRLLRSLNAHLLMADRIARLIPARSTMALQHLVLRDASQVWEQFRSDYNARLSSWNEFADRVTRVLGYGVGAGPKPLPGLG